MTFIIDGDNYLYVHRGIEGMLPIDNHDAARAEMLELLEEYKKAVQREVIVVLDGRRPSGPEGRSPGEVHVRYADSESDADSVIEYLVKSWRDDAMKSGAGKAPVVVSSDRGVQAVVGRLGATVLSSGEFYRRAVKAVNRRRMEEAEPKAKYDYPDPHEVEFWDEELGGEVSLDEDLREEDEEHVERLKRRKRRKPLTPPTKNDDKKSKASPSPSLSRPPRKKKKRSRKEPSEKPPSTSAEEVQYWLDKFDKESGKNGSD